MSFLSNNIKSTVLISGGGSGIGLALAERFVSMGHEVIVFGRTQSKLDAAKAACPQLTTFQADVSDESGRKALLQRVLKEYPQVNVLINNAAICKTPKPMIEASEEDWAIYTEEVNINLLAPMQLSLMFLPHLAKKQHAMIANVSSVMAFTPSACHPSYCVAKAGLHSFTQTLRESCAGTSVKVVEIIPPLVDTDMVHPEKRGQGISPDVFAQSVVTQILDGVEEVTYHEETIVRGSREELDAFFDKKSNKLAAVSGVHGKRGSDLAE